MSFPTWTFDNACQTMEWNELHASELSISTNGEDVNKSTDLLIMGIICTPEATDEVSAPSLTGPVKDLDDSLEGALSTAMSDNYKSFKHGAKAGASTPTLRLVGSAGAKVSQNMMYFLNPISVTTRDDCLFFLFETKY